MVMPEFSARSRMTSRTPRTSSGSSAEVGSSKSSTLGCMATARAMATRCCWPPESWAGLKSARSARPTAASCLSASASASARSFLSTLVWPIMTFSLAVRCGKRLNCWKTMPTSRRSLLTSAALLLVISSSSMRMWPALGVSSRLMQRSIVDLPEPDGPRTTTTSPGQTLRFTSLSTSVSSKLLLRCSMRTIGCSPGVKWWLVRPWSAS